MRVVAIAAVSLDGFITRHDTEGTDFTSVADRKFFSAALRESDCILYGSGTFNAAKERIASAINQVQLRVVLTSKPERYANYHVENMLEFSSKSPPEICSELKNRGKKRMAMLGGQQLFTSFLDDGLIDEFWITVEPRIFGSGKNLFTGRIDQALVLSEIKELSESVVVLKYHLPREG